MQILFTIAAVAILAPVVIHVAVILGAWVAFMVRCLAGVQK